MKTLNRKIFFVIVLSLCAMGTMPYGSFNPMNYGFWLSIVYGLFSVSFIDLSFHLLRKKGYLKDKKT